jgi:hypothetical protein
MHDSITIAEVGSIVKVSGSRMATPFGPRQSRQHTDEDAEQEADQHQRSDLPRQQDAKPWNSSESASMVLAVPRSRGRFERPLGMMTSNAISKVTNMITRKGSS